MNTIRIILVDDHTVVRRGLRSYLDAFADIEVVGEAASGEACLDGLEAWLPDVAVMDLLMPGGIDGIETTRRARALSPHTQIVVLTAHMDEARVVAALRAGAIGYVRKDAEPELLLTAVRAAARGQSMLDPSIAGSVLQEVMGEAEGLKLMTIMIKAQPVPIREQNGVFLAGQSRVPIDTIIRYYHWGNTPEEIVLQFPALQLNDVYGVINYYLNNRDVVDVYLLRRQQESEAIRQENEKRFPPQDIRAKLVARLEEHA